MTGNSIVLTQFPLIFGSDQESDVLVNHTSPIKCAVLTVLDGDTLNLSQIDDSVDIRVNGIKSSDFTMEAGQEKSIQIAQSFFLIKGGQLRELKSWSSTIQHTSWCLYNIDNNHTYGPMSLFSLFDYINQTGMRDGNVLLHLLGQQAGFFTTQFDKLFPQTQKSRATPLPPLPPPAASQNFQNFQSGPTPPLPPVQSAPQVQPRQEMQAQPRQEVQAPSREDFTPGKIDSDRGEYTCPVCWLQFSLKDVMHIACHESLRGDPIIGEDEQQRFHATQFNDRGLALDAYGIPCSDMACPHCRGKLPPGFIELARHIFSIVGNASAGKSYYLTVLAKEMPNFLFRNFELVWQDGDPGGNALLNEMKNRLYGASSAEKASLEKTVLGGSTYVKVPRFGKTVQMPRPFVFNISSNKPGAPAPLNAVFYDNAGEHFRPDVRIEDAPGALHVASASGIFFLFDPLRNLEFRRRLENVPSTSAADPQLAMEMNDVQDIILSEMKTRILKVNWHGATERIKKPLAIIVGKYDAWSHLLDGAQLYQCVRNGMLDLDKIDSNSEITRNLLLDICPVIVGNAESLSENVKFFPVSAFGHTPERTSTGGIAPDPKRLIPILAEVPVVWALHQLSPELFPVYQPTA